MNISPENLASYFHASPEFCLVHRAKTPGNAREPLGIAGHLNLIRPYQLQLVHKNEWDYLNTLNNTELLNLSKKLSKQGTLYLLFNEPYPIPQTLFQQNNLHLIISKKNKHHSPETLSNELNAQFSERISKHGSLIVIQGRGILITGSSGVGKSSLLLSLVKQNHLWVADDICLFYLNNQNKIIGRSEEKLSEYIHIKGLGPINMNKNYGQASRIPSHPLDAIIHLSNNIENEVQQVCAYTQQDSTTLFDINLPTWHFSSTHPSLGHMIEQCAKNLILREWGHDPASELDNALNHTLQRGQ